MDTITRFFYSLYENIINFYKIFYLSIYQSFELLFDDKLDITDNLVLFFWTFLIYAIIDKSYSISERDFFYNPQEEWDRSYYSIYGKLFLKLLLLPILIIPLIIIIYIIYLIFTSFISLFFIIAFLVVFFLITKLLFPDSFYFYDIYIETPSLLILIINIIFIIFTIDTSIKVIKNYSVIKENKYVDYLVKSTYLNINNKREKRYIQKLLKRERIKRRVEEKLLSIEKDKIFFEEKERLEKERLEKERLEKERLEKERLEKERQEELLYEKLEVIYATINEKNVPNCLAKLDSSKFYNLIRTSENAPPFKNGEILKIKKSSLNEWTSFSEEELEKELKKLKISNQNFNKKIQLEKEQNEKLSKYNIDYLYHMTHINNLDNILKNGLKSNTEVKKHNLIKVDISDNDVNDRRVRPEPIYKRKIHDYVPLYFNPRNPMLYKRLDLQDDIVILGINKKIFHKEKVIFTDGNAASNSTSFFNNINYLENINWSCIKNDYWNKYEDGKRIKCAEVLVPNKIETQFIDKIFCNNPATKKIIETKLKEYKNITTEVRKSLYFT